MGRLMPAVSACLLALLVGCHGHGRHSSHATEVRFLNASPDAGRLDFVIDGYLRATLDPDEMSRYLRMFSGQRLLDVWSGSRLLLTARVQIEHGDEQTFVLIGSRAASTLDVVQLLDPDGLAAPQTARITFLHTSPDAPELDVDLDGQPLFTRVGYLGTSAIPDWTTVASGLRQVTIRESGGRGRFGPFAFDLGSRQDLTVVVSHWHNVMELRVWDDFEAALQNAQSRVRFLNAAAEMGPMQVLLDGRAVAARVPFRRSSPYLPAFSGTRTIEIRSGRLTRVKGPVSLQSGVDYTVSVSGRLASLAGVRHTDGPYLANPGTFAFEFLHLGPDAGPVDVRVNGVIPSALRNVAYLGSNPPPAPPPALLQELTSPADRLDLFEVFQAGTQRLLGRTTLVPAEYGVYTVVLLGERTRQGTLGVGDTAPAVLVLEESADGRRLDRLRPGHASPTHGALTFKLDGSRPTDAISPSLTYLGRGGVPGAYVHLAPGQHTLLVTPTGSTAVLASAALSSGFAADATQVVLEPSVANPTPRLAGVLDPDGPLPAPPGRARLRLHHAARGVSSQALDLYVNGVSGPPLISHVTFSTASAYVAIAAGTGQSLQLTPAGNPAVVLLSRGGLTFDEGRDYSFVALATNSATNLTESALLADN